MNLNNVYFPLFKQSCKLAECSNKEDRCEVENVTVLFMVSLSHVAGGSIHATHCIKDFGIQSFLFILIVQVFLLWCLRITGPFVNLFVILFHKNLLPDLPEVLKLQVLNEDHLRVEHELLMIIHLFTEVIARGSEVKDQMEVLSHPLEEIQVKLVANIGILFNYIAHILLVCELVDLLLRVLCLFSLFATNKSVLRLFELCLDRDQRCKHVMMSSDLRAHIRLDESFEVFIPRVVKDSVLIANVGQLFVF